MPVWREPGVLDAADFLSFDSCLDRDYKALATAPAGAYMEPAGMALSMLETVPPDRTISNLTYHRASPGIRKMFETFLLTDGQAKRAALQPFDYLAFCSYPFEVEALKGSLFSALLSDKSWPGLQPVVVDGGERLRVFRIDHANLQ